MARKSRYENAEQTIKTVTGWKVGSYMRLSREDGDKEESNSISSQKELLSYYISEHTDMIDIKEYIDDGWSGTNFDRPGFKEMIEDIKKGTINCILVKDLSRLGRNYIEVGRYLEMIFPMLNVRFIAINDSLDSTTNPDSMNSVIVPFKNILNDEYCRDISNKIRSVLDAKRRQGKFIGSFTSYGYLKDPEDKNHLIIDEEVAPIVRDIFDWCISGMSVMGIAKKLNVEKIPNPSTYKKMKGLKFKCHDATQYSYLWCDSSVRRILTNPLYAGDMVQGKLTIKSYKIQKAVQVPKSQWITVPNTHEGIVDRETFDKVADILNRDRRVNSGQTHYAILAGYVKCADCGRAMAKKVMTNPNKEYFYYVCRTNTKASNTVCTKHSIRNDRLEEAVLETLKAHIKIAVSMNDILAELNKKNESLRSSPRLSNALSEKEAELSKLLKCKTDLYPDWKSGVLSKEEYLTMKEHFDTQIVEVESEIKSISDEIESHKSVSKEKNSFLTYFLAHKDIQKLTREMVTELVDNVYVHENGEITIALKYQDEYTRLLDLIKENGMEVSEVLV